MKCSTAFLSVATLSLAMLTPAFGQTAVPNGQNGQGAGAREAAQMVPARASLLRTLDSQSAQPGTQFRAKMSDTVHLDNGVELHRGDTLLGKVVTDNMNLTGKSRLAVRFTQALLKNGQTVPIKATIVGIYTPGELPYSGYGSSEQIPNNWNDSTLRVDEIGAIKDIDLHSRIAGRDSGVFVSTKKDVVKIPGGSELALAIGARNHRPANMTSGS